MHIDLIYVEKTYLHRCCFSNTTIKPNLSQETLQNCCLSDNLIVAYIANLFIPFCLFSRQSQNWAFGHFEFFYSQFWSSDLCLLSRNPYGEQHFSVYDFTGSNGSPVASMTELSQYYINITNIIFPLHKKCTRVFTIKCFKILKISENIRNQRTNHFLMHYWELVKQQCSVL